MRRAWGKKALSQIISDTHEIAAVTNAMKTRVLVLHVPVTGKSDLVKVKEGFSADVTL